MKLSLLIVALAAFATVAAAATCPFNIPVVTIAPQQIAGFSWGPVIRPMGDACVSTIVVEPANAAVWYVGGVNGLYMTKNAGAAWTHPLIGNVNVLLLVPGQPLVYAGIGKKLYLSRDHGANWNVIHTFNFPVQSLLVHGGTLFVGLGWSTHAVPSGVFTSNLGGGFMTFHPFGAGQTGLIVWTLSRDPLSGMIYAGTEIFDHLPQPYKPPFFRSPNNGMAWVNVAGTLPWHVIASAVRPNDGYVYALTEGPGLYGSANQGNSWIPPANKLGPSDSLLMDPIHPTRLFGGRQKSGTVNGGIFLSTNAGLNFKQVGLAGTTVSGLAMNGPGTKIYATAYASGIYVSPVP